MQAGTVISFQLPEWNNRRYGQVLRRDFERMTVKLLRADEVLEIYNWAYAAFPAQHSNPAQMRMEWKPAGAGGSQMPFKTVVLADKERRRHPGWTRRLYAWLAGSKYKLRTYWVQDLQHPDALARFCRQPAYFYERCFRIKGYCCIDGDFIPVRRNTLMTPVYMEQYNFLAHQKPALWNSIQPTLSSTS